jgi:hypothetical protein
MISSAIKLKCNIYVTLFSCEQETYKEKMEKASDNGTKEVDLKTKLNLWAESAEGKIWGRLYGNDTFLNITVTTLFYLFLLKSAR